MNSKQSDIGPETSLEMTSDTEVEEKCLVYSSLRFFVTDDVLKAEFEPDVLEQSLDHKTIIELLASSGFGTHQLDSEILDKLQENSVTNHQGEVTLTPHTNASYEITVNEQQLSATITVTAPQGGVLLDFDEVLAALIEDKMDEDNIDQKALKRSLLEMSDTAIVIANGIDQQSGQDATFEILFDKDTTKKRNINTEEAIDYYESHQYITVVESQPLMKRTPATKGIAGKTIFAEAIPAIDGEETPFQIDDTVTLDPANENILVAAKKGHPIALDTGAHVDDTLTIKDADLKSGNIHFDGSVYVSGEVKPNVVIEANGDIHVDGLVENARLISGNNISIASGALGIEPTEHGKSDQHFECCIKAEGSIHLKYCNNIEATAKLDILVDDYSMHCRLKAERNIELGSNNGKGILIGGSTNAGTGLTANVIGSEAYIKTELETASLKSLKSELRSILGKSSRSKSEYEMLLKILRRIRGQGTPTTVGRVVLEKAKKIHLETKVLENDITTLECQLEDLRSEIETRKDAAVKVQKKLYPNVELTINDIHESNKREHGAMFVLCIDNSLQYNPA